MKRGLAALCGSVFVLALAPRGLPPYPATAKIPVADRYFSRTVVDPYRWLENGADPRVKAWAERQSDYARAFLEKQPAYSVLGKRIETLARTSTSRFGLTIANGQWIYERTTPPQAQPQLVARTGEHGAERVLYDPLQAAHGKPPSAIESVFVARDGSKVAYTTQEGGAEEETLHLVDVASGAPLPDTIEHAGGGTSPAALAWDADGKGFIYARWPQNVPEAEAHFNIALYHHALGMPPANDTYVFGRGLPKAAEYALLVSRDGSRTAAFVSAGDVPDHAVYVREGSGEFQQVAAASDHVKDGTFIGKTLLLRSSARNANYEVIGVDPGQTFATARTFIPASGVVIDGVASAGGRVFTHDIDGGESAVRVFSAQGSPLGSVPLPAHAALGGIAGDENGGEIVIAYASYDTPNRWVRYVAQTNSVERTGIETTTPGDYSKLVIKRVFVPSTDGTVKIPLTIVSLPNAKRDGTAPTLLTAYGAYGIISSPRFLGTWLAWLERGGVYAQANIRGGGEYGERWHQAAHYATKTNSSDDLAACAHWLGTHGYGTHRHLGILGGSAGGFLMGLALTRNPGLYRAVVAQVGFYDSLRTELSPNGFFNIPEFGTVKDPANFAWMIRQSPYHNVRDGAAYPAVLMTTGANDPRVEPMHSRKMVARLQAASSSGLPVLLIQKSGEGHGIGSSFSQRLSGTIQAQTFLATELQ